MLIEVPVRHPFYRANLTRAHINLGIDSWLPTHLAAVMSHLPHGAVSATNTINLPRNTARGPRLDVMGHAPFVSNDQ